MPSITFRVSEAQKKELEMLARGNLSNYLKRVLDRHAEADHTFEILLQRLEHIEGQISSIEGFKSARTAPDESASFPPEVIGWLLEMLLMLRVAIPEEQRKFAQAEVKRLGLPVYDSSKVESF